MRNRFDQELDDLSDAMMEMSSSCEEAINMTIDALMNGNKKKAKSVVDSSHQIRRMEREIENIDLKLLMQQQPVASDLRTISSSLKAVYDLERIGDVAGDIADLILNENVSTASDILNIQDMANAAQAMVVDSIKALSEKDEALARSVIKCDDIVDEAFVEAKNNIVKRFSEDANVEYALNLLMVVKYFEKIGDHAVNIAQWALYASTGVIEPIK
jgi:phosphate transport system protein